MNILRRYTNKWLVALVLVTFVAGCGDDNDGAWNAPAGTANEMTAYSLDGTAGVVTEGTTPKTIDVVMPSGTDLSLALIATYTTTGASVMIDTVVQESGVTENVFLSVPQAPVIYTVTAVDGSTATYEVNVTVAASDAAVMTSYSLNGIVGIVSEDTIPKTIEVIMPFGTDLSLPMIATFVATGDVEIDTVLQESGVTTNVFTLSPPASAIYTIIAADGIASATYEVNVTVAANDAAAITSYSLDGIVGIIGEDTIPKTIAVEMPFGTDLAVDLIATFTTSPGASVMIDVTPQVSTETPNNFTNQVIYTVSAADGVTTATYNVDVTVALVGSNPTAPNLGEAGRFVILASQTITTTGASVISNGDMGIMDQARSYLTTGGFTPGTNPGEFTQLANGLSYASDDSNTIATAPYSTPYPIPMKTATVVIGSEWATTLAMIDQARTDLGIAYTFLAGTNPTAPTQTLASTQLGGQTLTAGVYYSSAGVLITTAPLQLDALGDPNAVWIFTIDGTLTTGAPSGAISFVGGVGQAKNVYWRTGGDTVIEAGVTFIGNVFSNTQVNVLGGANVTGSLFAVTNQVTLGDSAITKAP
jgi:hypothetical protein